MPALTMPETFWACLLGHMLLRRQSVLMCLERVRCKYSLQ